MSSKNVGRSSAGRAKTILTFSATILLAPVFAILALYAYTLILSSTGASTAIGCGILVAIFASLGFLIFKR